MPVLDNGLPPLLDLQNISVMRGDKLVLDKLSLSIGAHEHVAILGPNGCGKSTLIKTITRECYPLAREGSSVSIFGRKTWNVFELRTLLGIVSPDLAATCTREYTGLEIVLGGFFSSIGVQTYHTVTDEMRAESEEALARLEASYLAQRLTSEMSSGEARRVLIARALVHHPKALLFDEPSTALDLFAHHELREMLRALARQGTGIVLVTHDLSDIIPEIDRVVLMQHGRVVADGPKQELLTEMRLSQLFGVNVCILERGGYYHGL
ncbi:MAG: ATP-binding cassette domain-containing protein [Bryobacteraceae bacterium]